LREKWAAFDAERRFPISMVMTSPPTDCRSGDVLSGRIKPTECPHFGNPCTPENPLGAPMVSSEGASSRCGLTTGSEPTMTWQPQCPAGPTERARVLLAHGEGAGLSRQLIRQRILSRLGNSLLDPLGDAALLPPLAGRPVLTTDSFVVTPLFFPGGDIGRLAVLGTVNDLAVSGARPRWLSLALILEEGLPFDTLDRILDSIATAARETGVLVATGDTKVVPYGAADQIFITTTGLGELFEPAPPGPAAIVPGDELIVSGPVGRHGIAVLAAREQLGLDPPPISDCANLIPAVQGLRAAQVPVRALRDATRGGVAAVLHEWSAACGATLEIVESQVPVSDDVRGACELLGLDPLTIACEGTMVLAVPAGSGPAAIAALQDFPTTSQAVVIGEVTGFAGFPVGIRRLMGRLQPLDAPSGLLLPRIQTHSTARNRPFVSLTVARARLTRSSVENVPSSTTDTRLACHSAAWRNSSA
jgi:hydrogenase expression/formation protein HypE